MKSNEVFVQSTRTKKTNKQKTNLPINKNMDHTLE